MHAPHVLRAFTLISVVERLEATRHLAQPMPPSLDGGAASGEVVCHEGLQVRVADHGLVRVKDFSLGGTEVVSRFVAQRRQLSLHRSDGDGGPAYFGSDVASLVVSGVDLQTQHHGRAQSDIETRAQSGNLPPAGQARSAGSLAHHSIGWVPALLLPALLLPALLLPAWPGRARLGRGGLTRLRSRG
ncbi:MAG: hypothetical protein WKF73_20800 [Nocardioidaceae bacterium]